MQGSIQLPDIPTLASAGTQVWPATCSYISPPNTVMQCPCESQHKPSSSNASSPCKWYCEPVCRLISLSAWCQLMQCCMHSWYKFVFCMMKSLTDDSGIAAPSMLYKLESLCHPAAATQHDSLALAGRVCTWQEQKPREIMLGSCSLEAQRLQLLPAALHACI